MSKRNRAVTLKVLTSLLALLVAFTMGELALRRAGYEPWKEIAHADMPVMREEDPELGWRNKPGSYVFGADPIRVRFWADRTRATAPGPIAAAETAVVLGCSVVEGWGLSDDQTFAWKLQERFPGTRFLNFGTAGYGTTQSLLALKRYLAGGGERPHVVIYGFSDFHEARNVATAEWLKALALGRLTPRGNLGTPYATLASTGALEFHPPKSFPAWWLHRELATVALLEERWAQLDASKRTSQAISVTENLLLELHHEVRQAGGTLLVATLSEIEPGHNEPYRAMLEARGIPTAECVHPGAWSPAMQVPTYGHPNAKINAYWADCITQALKDEYQLLR